MKKNARTLIINVVSLALMLASLYMQRTVGKPWSTLVFALGLGIFLIHILLIKLRTEKEETDAFDKNEEKAAVRASADVYNTEEDTEGLPFLLVLHSLSGKIYQVLRGDRAYFFCRVGGELRGVDPEKLLDHVPSDRELDSLPGKNFRIEMSSVEKLELAMKHIPSTPLPNSGIVRFFTPKKRSYIVLDELPEKQVRDFFRALGSRLAMNAKANRKGEEARSIGQWKKARQDPAKFRTLYKTNIALLVLGTICSLAFLFLGTPYVLWSVLCLLCSAAVIVLLLVFPDYFSLVRTNRESIEQTGSKSISAIGPLMASNFGPVLRTLMDFNFMSWQRFLLAGIVFSLLITALLYWRCLELRRRFSHLLCAWVLLLFFSFGIPGQLNFLLDFSEPEVLPVRVVDMHISKSSRSPDEYVLTVQLDDGTEKDLNVAKSVYDETQIGDMGSMELYRGGLGIPYAEYASNQRYAGR